MPPLPAWSEFWDDLRDWMQTQQISGAGIVTQFERVPNEIIGVEAHQVTVLSSQPLNGPQERPIVESHLRKWYDDFRKITGHGGHITWNASHPRLGEAWPKRGASHGCIKDAIMIRYLLAKGYIRCLGGEDCQNGGNCRWDSRDKLCKEWKRV